MKTGRPKGSKVGSVFFNKNKNRWTAVYYVFDSKTMKDKTLRKLFREEKDAREFLENVQYQRGNEIFIKHNGIPLGQLLDLNLENKLDMNLISEGQYTRSKDTIKIIKRSDISKMMIDRIKDDHIQTFLNSIKHYSNSQLKKIMEQLSQAFNLAMNKEYINKNPMKNVLKPKSKQQEREVRPLEVEEQQVFSNYLMNQTAETQKYKNVCLIQMYMGLRIGETLALTSGNINLQKKILYVTNTLTLDKNKKIIMGDTTKTYSGKREVPIPNFMFPHLIEQLKIAENNRDNLLFVNDEGDYINGNNVNSFLKRRLDKMGIFDITTHSLRHTFGTRCIEAGIAPVVVQRLMGHKDIRVTLNTYMKVLERFRESEIKKVNDYYLNNSIVSAALLPEEVGYIENTIDGNEFCSQDEEEIRNRINEINQYILFDSRVELQLLKLANEHILNKAIALLDKNIDEKEWHKITNKNCYKTWAEINAFLDGLCIGKNCSNRELVRER